MKKIQDIPWSEKIKSEKVFVKKDLYKKLLPDVFETIGENMPEQLQTYISENTEARDGQETEVPVTNKHLSAKAKSSGRADLLIPFTTKNGEEHALWIETMDKSGKWNYEHHDQWRNKMWSLTDRYDRVIPVMIADKFDSNFVNNFDEWSNRGLNVTHAIELNFQKIEKEWGFKMTLRTDSYLDDKSYQGGLTNSQIANKAFYEKLRAMFENTDIEIYSNESEQTGGYYRVKYQGDWAGFYLRRSTLRNDMLGILGQNSEYASKYKHEVYEMIKYSSNDVKEMMRECGNIELTFNDAKDPQLLSKLTSVEDAKMLVESFINCVIDTK